MATGLHPYLNFPGNTREAMECYGQVFGVAPQIATFGQFNAVPADHEHADKVMHSSLEVTDLIRGYFDGLAEGGNVIMALEQQVWGDLYGALIDKFGISWMFNIGQSETA